MSDVVSQRPDPEDLSVHVRRGHASGVERRALARQLERDANLRVAHQVGLDLDRDSSVRAGDEQLIANAADAALARALSDAPAPSASPATARRLRFVGWQLVASMVAVFALSFSGVSAALWVASVVPWGKSETDDIAPQPKPARHARTKVRTAAPPEPEVAALPPAPPVMAEPEPLEPEAAVADKPSHHRVHTHDPKALFHAANSARRTGDWTRAKQLYGELIAHVPSSDEAHLAHVSLGKLLLAQGQPAAAEHAFSRYLQSGGGPLSEEALFSRAQCLLRLGRSASERAAWRALLAAFPESVYAVQAKQRLTVLEVQPR